MGKEKLIERYIKLQKAYDRIWDKMDEIADMFGEERVKVRDDLEIVADINGITFVNPYNDIQSIYMEWREIPVIGYVVAKALVEQEDVREIIELYAQGRTAEAIEKFVSALMPIFKVLFGEEMKLSDRQIQLLKEMYKNEERGDRADREESD